MYTDTKNFTNINEQQIAANSVRNNKSRSKMRQILKPLLRLLTLKSTQRQKCGHPNNIDLNNTQMQFVALQTNTEAAVDSTDIKEHICSESAAVKQQTQLVHMSADCCQPCQPCQPSSALHSESLISSVYIEKSSVSNCNGCAYGRNCQHVQDAACANALPQSRAELNLLQDLHLPLQFISTDNGSFVWAQTAQRLDDELLNAFLCGSYSSSMLSGTLC